ncbi:hemerythrin domain-containing protein [Phormidium sp. FACHB-592]|uniref:Hemerythrin domain-containing protein n=1 Tax=Stenomitos frigidus AS-A4 TaxID=2933935 RepID=A0ABV0KE81_9CYAN|nr:MULTISPECIES: hemerythrin domain-containing protein [Cyanophyceae]MBD2034654.1 hemerythrin domain-containing protein [Leptolyngbya sp. FACHB-321]MBD2076142.1 hemerythrin domain-containing protein [Phormidium sp. FACHB-592]
MVSTLNDAKRAAIGQQLASIKAIQELLISNEQTLLPTIPDANIRDRFQDMLKDDQKNLGILDTVIVQYGIKEEPKETVTELVEKAKQLAEGSELSLYEKVFQHELLKHQQAMSGILVHKAAQKVGADVEAAIAPLNTVNFENRAHQEQLKGVLEVLGVRELTGEEADQGLWARVQDAVAAVTGVAGSVITQNSDKSDMNIQDVIRMDHQKVNVLFTELNQSNDPQKIQEYFGQIYKDLTVHAKAEEQVVYPAIRSFYGDHDTQELYDEQAQMTVLLDEIKSLNPADSQFKTKVNQLKDIVMDHVRQEESTMFAAIRNNCSSDQSEQMATQFKAAKSQLQDQLKAALH